MTKLVCDLLCRGNAFLTDEDWERASGEFSKGLDIWHDVREKKIHLSEDLLEGLYVGRAATFHSMVIKQKKRLSGSIAVKMYADIKYYIILFGNTRSIVVQM